MDVESLFNETLKRYSTRELSQLEQAKLEFICKKTVENNPKKNLEDLILIVRTHLAYVMGFQEL